MCWKIISNVLQNGSVESLVRLLESTQSLIKQVTSLTLVRAFAYAKHRVLSYETLGYLTGPVDDFLQSLIQSKV
jgi:hypothetical protein